MFIKLHKNNANKLMANIKSIKKQSNKDIRKYTDIELINLENQYFEEIFMLNLNQYLITSIIKQNNKDIKIRHSIINKEKIKELYEYDKYCLLYNYKDNFKNLITLDKILYKNNIITN